MIKEQEIQTTDWLEEQTCANRILLTTASQHPVPNEDQARYVAGRSVVSQLCNGAPVPLRELLQMPLVPKGETQPPGAPMLPKASRKWREGLVAHDMRRPSVHNPGDRPSGIVKTSQAGIHNDSFVDICGTADLKSCQSCAALQVASKGKAIHARVASQRSEAHSIYEYAR